MWRFVCEVPHYVIWWAQFVQLFQQDMLYQYLIPVSDIIFTVKNMLQRQTSCHEWPYEKYYVATAWQIRCKRYAFLKSRIGNSDLYNIWITLFFFVSVVDWMQLYNQEIVNSVSAIFLLNHLFWKWFSVWNCDIFRKVAWFYFNFLPLGR